MIRSLVLSAALMATSASAAMILGFGAEADYYASSADGHFNYKGTMTSFSNDNESAYQVGFYLEHPVPVLPNFRVDLTSRTSFSGSNGLGGSNKVSFSQTDITPYYEILDNVVDLDIGLTFKVMDGKVEGVVNETFTEVIPMGYVAAAVAIPSTGLSVGGNVKYIGYDGDSFTDARIKASWNIAAGLEAQAGYRYESLNVSNRFSTNADVTFKGPFVGISYRF